MDKWSLLCFNVRHKGKGEDPAAIAAQFNKALKRTAGSWPGRYEARSLAAAA
jgi:hypothetical protein